MLVDVLILIEHIQREYEAARQLSHRLCAYGASCFVHKIYDNPHRNLVHLQPKVVVHPFFYSSVDANINTYIVNMFPGARHVNWAWEQIHYRAQREMKRPKGRFLLDEVFHLAWGNASAQFLAESGVRKEHIHVVGHPALSSRKATAGNDASLREELALIHRLSHEKHWLLFPDNYRWAFLSDRLEFFAKANGLPVQLYREISAWSVASLSATINALEKLGESHSDLEIIFRPRPNVPSVKYDEFFKAHGLQRKHIRVIPSGTAKEWVSVADTVVSSYSTVLLEAVHAKKRVYKFLPLGIPNELTYEWMAMIPDLEPSSYYNDPTPNVAQRSLEPFFSLGDAIEKAAIVVSDILKISVHVTGRRVTNSSMECYRYRLSPSDHRNDCKKLPQAFFAPEESTRKMSANDAHSEAQTEGKTFKFSKGPSLRNVVSSIYRDLYWRLFA